MPSLREARQIGHVWFYFLPNKNLKKKERAIDTLRLGVVWQNSSQIKPGLFLTLSLLPLPLKLRSVSASEMPAFVKPFQEADTFGT